MRDAFDLALAAPRAVGDVDAHGGAAASDGATSAPRISGGGGAVRQMRA